MYLIVLFLISDQDELSVISYFNLSFSFFDILIFDF
jgi:hypothetical protein